MRIYWALTCTRYILLGIKVNDSKLWDKPKTVSCSNRPPGGHELLSSMQPISVGMPSEGPQPHGTLQPRLQEVYLRQSQVQWRAPGEMEAVNVGQRKGRKHRLPQRPLSTGGQQTQRQDVVSQRALHGLPSLTGPTVWRNTLSVVGGPGKGHVGRLSLKHIIDDNDPNQKTEVRIEKKGVLFPVGVRVSFKLVLSELFQVETVWWGYSQSQQATKRKGRERGVLHVWNTD